MQAGNSCYNSVRLLRVLGLLGGFGDIWPVEYETANNPQPRPQKFRYKSLLHHDIMVLWKGFTEVGSAT